MLVGRSWMAAMASVVNVGKENLPSANRWLRLLRNGDGGWFSALSLCRACVAWVVVALRCGDGGSAAASVVVGFPGASVTGDMLDALSGVEGAHGRFGGRGGQDSLRWVGGFRFGLFGPLRWVR
jgi:hypothetical protein